MILEIIASNKFHMKSKSSDIISILHVVPVSRHIRFAKIILALVAIGLFALVSACSGVQQTDPLGSQTLPSSSLEIPAYPSPDQMDASNTSYPRPENAPSSLLAYPAPGDTGKVDADIRFIIDTPVYAGATSISGTGLDGTQIQVVDISTAGSVLGSGVVGKDNRFSIQLASPLEANRSIGIELIIPRETQTWADLWELRGDNARSIPGMGYYIDTVVTQAK